MSNVSTRLRDYAVRRSVLIERFKFGQARQLNNALDAIYAEAYGKVESQFKKTGFNLMGGLALAHSRKSFLSGFNSLGIVFAGALESFVEDEARFIQQAVSNASSIRLGLNSSLPAQNKPVVIQGVTLKEYEVSLAEMAYNDYRKVLRLAMAEGVDQRTALFNLSQARSLSTARIERFVRTAIGAYSSHARENFYLRNEKYFKGVAWVVVIDRSQECNALAKEIYPVGLGARPPGHFNCGATTIPVFKPALEIVSRAGPAILEELDGANPSRIKFKTWLNSQSQAIQNEVLGLQRARLFRQGEGPDEFTVTLLDPLTLDQLKRQMSNFWLLASS